MEHPARSFHEASLDPTLVDAVVLLGRKAVAMGLGSREFAAAYEAIRSAPKPPRA
jgi:hypothetical protein